MYWLNGRHRCNIYISAYLLFILMSCCYEKDGVQSERQVGCISYIVHYILYIVH